MFRTPLSPAGRRVNTVPSDMPIPTLWRAFPRHGTAQLRQMFTLFMEHIEVNQRCLAARVSPPPPTHVHGACSRRLSHGAAWVSGRPETRGRAITPLVGSVAGRISRVVRCSKYRPTCDSEKQITK